MSERRSGGLRARTPSVPERWSRRPGRQRSCGTWQLPLVSLSTCEPTPEVDGPKVQSVALQVVIAPDSFKGSLDAAAAAEAIGSGWRAARPLDEVLLLPQADGGEGTLDAIATAVENARLRDVGPVTGPDGRPVEGHWLELPD